MTLYLYDFVFVLYILIFFYFLFFIFYEVMKSGKNKIEMLFHNLQIV